MKTIVKIVVTFAVLTACFQAGRYYLNNFQFEDAAAAPAIRDPGQRRRGREHRPEDRERVSDPADG